MKQAGSALGCNAFLCRGYQYEDNTAMEYTPGQVIDFHVDLIAGHHPGYAASRSTGPFKLAVCHANSNPPFKNVSIVDLATNKIIGDPLRSWDDYPNATATTPRSDSTFNPRSARPYIAVLTLLQSTST